MTDYYINKYTRERIDNDFKAVSPGYAKLGTRRRYFILNKIVAWVMNGKRHQHNRMEGYFFLWCKERNKYLGNKSNFITGSAGLIDVVDEYYRPTRTTKAYAPTAKAKQIIIGRLISEIDTPKQLLHFSGKKLNAPMAAIMQKDANERQRRCGGNLSSLQPINRDSIKCLLKQSFEQKEKLLQTGNCDFKFLGNKTKEQLENKLDRIRHGCISALYSSANDGYENKLPLYYREAGGGRLVGMGIHLQSLPREVKDAALVGGHDYDIVNCHVTLAAQLGNRYGLNTDGFEWYIDIKKNPSELRYLANEFMIDTSTLKQAMLALTYGAVLTDYPNYDFAIPCLLTEMATEFKQHPEIANFAAQSRNIRNTVTNKAVTQRNGTVLINHLGKPLEKASASNDTQFAHLLHGYEAQMLHHAIDLVGDNITLLSHDGFVTKRPINTEPIIQQYEKSTGLKIELKRTDLTYPFAA
jgi:hypothetical protein